VTGSSDGIGLALTRELAAAGLNVILHGRNSEKLSRVRDALQKEFPKRSFRTLVVDASGVPCAAHSTALSSVPVQGANSATASAEAAAVEAQPINFEAIRSQLEDTHLTILINNIGGGPRSPRFVPLPEMPEDKLLSNISVNALFPLCLTRALLPLLKRNSDGNSRPTLVLNVSTLIDTGVPLLCSYSASKAFIMALTRAVRWELLMEKGEEGGKFGSGEANVEVLGVRVGRVTDADGSTAPPTFFMPDARTMAKAALARAGYGYGVVVGYWKHALLYYCNACLVAVAPRWVGDAVLMGAIRYERDADERWSQKN
jgi:17beta-estradiol 17-dehydrogenase / very-long-chain 3-oxoacyl-CoA reductase